MYIRPREVKSGIINSSNFCRQSRFEVIHLKQTYTCVRYAPMDPWDVRIDRTTPVFSTSPPIHTHRQAHAYGCMRTKFMKHHEPPHYYDRRTPPFKLNLEIEQIFLHSNITFLLLKFTYTRIKSLTTKQVTN